MGLTGNSMTILPEVEDSQGKERVTTGQRWSWKSAYSTLTSSSREPTRTSSRARHSPPRTGRRATLLFRLCTGSPRGTLRRSLGPTTRVSHVQHDDGAAAWSRMEPHAHTPKHNAHGRSNAL